MKAMASSRPGGEPRVPYPPGMRRTSRWGAEVKVCVGTTVWPMAEGWAAGWVEIGEREAPMRERVSGVL